MRDSSFGWDDNSDQDPRGSEFKVFETPDFSSLNFKELLAACPLDRIELERTREFPRDIDLSSYCSQLTEEVRTEMGIIVKTAAQVDPQVWEDVQAVLKRHDFTIADAFRLMLLHTAMGNELPFDCIIPNAETIAAMKELEHGEFVTVTSVDDLIAELNRDDDGKDR